MPSPDPVMFGNQLLDRLELPESPTVNITANGTVMITRRWKVNGSVNISQMPLPRQLDPLGYNARCVGSVSTPGPGNISMIESTFQGYITLPITIYEFANSRLDRPINQHPNFNNVTFFPANTKVLDPVSGQFQKFKDAGTSGDPTITFAGVEAYITGSSLWRKTSYSITPDFNQADVGTLNAPEAGANTGLPNQSNALLPGNPPGRRSWLKMEKNCVNELLGASIIWRITETWQFNQYGWLGQIYSVS